MVILEGYISVADEDLAQVKAALDLHCELTRAEPGCIIFSVIEDDNNANRFNVYEEFTDRQAFEAHQTRVKASHWGAITAQVARHYQITTR